LSTAKLTHFSSHFNFQITVDSKRRTSLLPLVLVQPKGKYLSRGRISHLNMNSDKDGKVDPFASDSEYDSYDGAGGRDATFQMPPIKPPGAGGGGFRPFAPPVSAADMTDELRERILRVMVDAFDNLPPPEVAAMLAALWAAGPAAGPRGDSLAWLVLLTAEVEAIEAAAVARVRAPGAAMGLEDLEDAIRVARSRVRMWGKDAGYYTGEMSLDPWRLPWQ
jgi:hypothetical protein